MPSYKIKSWTLSLMLIFITYDFTSSEIGTTIGHRDGCGERLERALDALQRDTNRRRNRLEDGESREPNYQEELRSAPLAMTITRIAVKVYHFYRPSILIKQLTCKFFNLLLRK